MIINRLSSIGNELNGIAFSEENNRQPMFNKADLLREQKELVGILAELVEVTPTDGPKKAILKGIGKQLAVSYKLDADDKEETPATLYFDLPAQMVIFEFNNMSNIRESLENVASILIDAKLGYNAPKNYDIVKMHIS